MRRGWLTLPGLLAALAAAPAGASASTLTIGPTPVRGYDMTLRVGGGDDLGVLKLTRHRGGSAQTHSFELRGIRYRMNRRLGVGTVRATLPSGGRINLRWRAAGAERSVAYGRGCEGRRRLRDGHLTGVLRLPLTHDYFGTIVRTRLRGRAEQMVGVHCPASTPRPPELSLRALHVDEGRRLLVHAARREGGAVWFTFAYEGGDVAGVHRIHVRAGSLTAATDLSNAEIGGSGPFLSGRLAFTATGPDTPSAGITRPGRLDGELTVRFDGLTAVTIRTLGGATLRLR